MREQGYCSRIGNACANCCSCVLPQPIAPEDSEGVFSPHSSPWPYLWQFWHSGEEPSVALLVGMVFNVSVLAPCGLWHVRHFT